MSEFLYFNCPGVKIWWFSSFSNPFCKNEKIEGLSTTDLGTFLAQFTHVHIFFSTKWLNFYILIVQEWKYDDFLHFLKLFKKSKKKCTFCPQRTWGSFWLNSHMCTFSIQMSEILYFGCPGVKIWWFSSFSKTSKNWKNWSFRPPWTLGPFWLNPAMCTFSIQLSEFLYFRCPEVKIWWFSSFSKTFRKTELKFSHTADLGIFLAQFTHAHIFHPNEWIFIL